MDRILGHGDEIQKSACGTNDLSGCFTSFGEPRLNNGPEEEATDLPVFGTTHAREVADPLQEEPNAMIWWETSNTSIEFCGAASSLEPCNKVFKDPLVQLVEDVGSD